MTWEKAENVPKAVIEEFENGTKVVVADHITPSGTGQAVKGDDFTTAMHIHSVVFIRSLKDLNGPS